MRKELIRIGFTDNEAIVFETLVGCGSIGASELSKKVSIDRSVTYNILDNLILKGYVSYVVEDRKKKFFIKKPESLLTGLNEKLSIAKDLVTDIKKKQVVSEKLPEVSIHEGKDSLKTLNLEWLESEYIYALNVIGKSEDLIPYHMAQIRLSKGKTKKGKVIASSEKGREAMKLYGVRSKMLPKEYKNEVPIVIHGDKVVITIYENDKPISIRIQNKKIADAFKKNFEYLYGLMK